jgi:hypothetical protein
MAIFSLLPLGCIPFYLNYYFVEPSQKLFQKRPNIFQFLIRATLRTSLVTMVGLAWNDQPLHDTFSKTVLISTGK